MGREFWNRIRQRNYMGALSGRSHFRAPARPHSAKLESETLACPRKNALLQRDRIHCLMDRGLSRFPHRLGAVAWRQVQELQVFDPAVPGLILDMDELIVATRQAATESEGSYRHWNSMKLESFLRWANELVEELERYRRDCELLRRT
jgi:hypothetical protein